MGATRMASVCFTGHRNYRDEARGALRRTIGALYEEGYRTFLSGMAAGFDLAAAEAVAEARASLPGLRLVAVVPFEGQQARFGAAERLRYEHLRAAADEVAVLAARYHPGVYLVRNDYLVGHASAAVAWFDGSPGGTDYTLRRALRLGLRIVNLCPRGPRFLPEPELFRGAGAQDGNG